MMVLLGVMLYGLIELGIGAYILKVYTIPLIGMTFSQVTNLPIINAVVGIVGIFLGPYLVLRGIIITVTLLFTLWEESKWWW